MAETNNIQQEPVYIPYGGQQMEQAPFMKAIADNVLNYVNQQTWSNKRKQKFLDAYSDIVSKGITGASNNSGLWAVDLGGNLDLESKSKKDLEMYHEAAYYILQQMKGIPTKLSQAEKEEAKKKDLQLYDNSLHLKAFTGYIGNNMFGGRNWDYTKDWDILDQRDKKTGILGTSGRMAKLADMLEGYSNSLEEGKYNFEGTAFKNLADLKGRIGNAVISLRNGVLDLSVKDSLNAIGLDWRTYLHDGSDETVTLLDGTTMTRGEYLEALQKQEADTAATKAAQEKLTALALKKANSGVLNLVSGIHAVEARSAAPAYANYLAKEYGVGLLGFDKINTAIQGLIEEGRTSGLSAKKKKQLGNLLYYIRENNPNYKGLGKGEKTNITNLEWEELSKHKNLKSQNRNNFIRLPWQTSDGRYTFADDKGNLYFLKPTKQLKLGNVPVVRSDAYNLYKQNFLKGTDIKNALDRANYLKSGKEGITSAEWEELASIGFDIASIVDPEMISAAGLALTGSGLRHHAAASQPGGMSTSDKWWLAADYGLSILGSIPVLGDSALAFRAINNLKKAIKPLGVIMAGANVPQAAKAAYNKVVNGQDLTVLDWRAIGAVLTAAVGVGRGRLMSKRAEALKKSAGVGTKTTKEGSVKTSEGEIKGLSEKTAKELKSSFKRAGNNNSKKTEILRNNSEIKTKAQEQGIDLSKAEISGESSLRNSRFTPRWTRSANEVSITPKNTNISGNRRNTLKAISNWDKNHGFLSRAGIRELDWVFRKTGGYESREPSNWFKSIWNNLKKSPYDEFGAPNTTNSTVATNRDNKFNRAIVKQYRDILNNKFSNNKLRSGDYNINGSKLLVVEQTDGTFNVIFKGKILANERNLIEILKIVRDVIKLQRVTPTSSGKNKTSTKEMGKILLNLKQKGWLKQGGTIQQDLNTTISNFLKTLK